MWVFEIISASQKLVPLVKNLPATAGDVRSEDLILGSGRTPGEENGNPLQYSCLENPMDRGAWWATVHGVTKSQIQLLTEQQQSFLLLLDVMTYMSHMD